MATLAPRGRAEVPGPEWTGLDGDRGLLLAWPGLKESRAGSDPAVVRVRVQVAEAEAEADSIAVALAAARAALPSPSSGAVAGQEPDADAEADAEADVEGGGFPTQGMHVLRGPTQGHADFDRIPWGGQDQGPTPQPPPPANASAGAAEDLPSPASAEPGPEPGPEPEEPAQAAGDAEEPEGGEGGEEVVATQPLDTAKAPGSHPAAEREEPDGEEALAAALELVQRAKDLDALQAYGAALPLYADAFDALEPFKATNERAFEVYEKATLRALALQNLLQAQARGGPAGPPPSGAQLPAEAALNALQLPESQLPRDGSGGGGGGLDLALPATQAPPVPVEAAEAEPVGGGGLLGGPATNEPLQGLTPTGNPEQLEPQAEPALAAAKALAQPWTLPGTATAAAAEALQALQPSSGLEEPEEPQPDPVPVAAEATEAAEAEPPADPADPGGNAGAEAPEPELVAAEEAEPEPVAAEEAEPEPVAEEAEEPPPEPAAEEPTTVEGPCGAAGFKAATFAPSQPEEAPEPEEEEPEPEEEEDPEPEEEEEEEGAQRLVTISFDPTQQEDATPTAPAKEEPAAEAEAPRALGCSKCRWTAKGCKQCRGKPAAARTKPKVVKKKPAPRKKKQAVQPEPQTKTPTPAKKRKHAGRSSPGGAEAAEAGAEAETPSKRGRAAGRPSPVVAFSSELAGAEKERQAKLAKKVGAQVAGKAGPSGSAQEPFSHVVATRFKRSEKMLVALASGRPIVSPQWLEASDQAGTVQDTDRFLLLDEAAERKHDFCLRHTLRAAQKGRVLAGRRVWLAPQCTNRAMLAALVPHAGGEVVPGTAHEAAAQAGGGLLAVADRRDRGLAPLTRAGVPLHSGELLLQAVVRGRLELEAFRL